MRQLMTLLAGTLLAYGAMESAAIAQVIYNCPPIQMESIVPMGLIPMGRTQQGDWLDLNPHSLRWTGNGVQFNYAINGQTIQGITSCNGSWTVNGRQHRPTSDAARTMMNYVCGNRVRRY